MWSILLEKTYLRILKYFKGYKPLFKDSLGVWWYGIECFYKINLN
jgi:hypothetical protein